MALQKQNVPINFAQGLDTKTDPKQVQLGKFLKLGNSVFTEGKQLTKRNGFGPLHAVPLPGSSLLTTFNGNLSAVGNFIQAYNPSLNEWVSKGSIQPVELSTLPLIRSSNTQSQADIAILNGLICTTYTDIGSAVAYKVTINDLVTGQNIVSPFTLTTANAAFGTPRVFALGKYFIILFSVQISSIYHLQYVSVDSTTLSISNPIDLTNDYTPHSTLAFDGLVFQDSLYLAWNGSNAGGSILVSVLSSNLMQGATVPFVGSRGFMFSLAVDTSPSTPVIYISSFDGIGVVFTVLAVTTSLAIVLPPMSYLPSPSGSVENITSYCLAGEVQILYEVGNAYGYDSSIPTNYIQTFTVSQTGSQSAQTVVLRSVGLASKAFKVTQSGLTFSNNGIYFACAYNSPFQPTYFVSDSLGNIIVKLAYQNGGGYLPTGLPAAIVSDDMVQFPYLFKDQLLAVNKLTNPTAPGGIYSQTGVNLASVMIGTSNISTSEIGQALHLSGGFLWMYDGYLPVEHNFHLYPDSVEGIGSVTGGGLKAQKYNYQVVYQWTDNQGNLFHSAPSVPAVVDLSGFSTTPITFTSHFGAGANSITASSVTGLFIGQTITDNSTGGNIAAGTIITNIVGLVLSLSIPTAGASGGGGDTLQTVDTCSIAVSAPSLRLTYKIPNPVQIVFYRWSTDNQVFYQLPNALTNYNPNVKATDYVGVIDTYSDAEIIGNNIIYTTGGVAEDIAAPSFTSIALSQSRLFGIDAEDQNLLWFSKQVIEATPVEMSDLFTLFIPPTQGAQGSTGVLTALGELDQRTILFKRNAIYYITGNGPDNTGANNDFSDPIFITSTVGCDNQRSIVFIPQGLIFQSAQGFYLLARDLTTPYIGAAVEEFNSAKVVSALNIPNTTQVRFTLDTGVILLYDWYYEQWGSFAKLPAISATLYNGLHTYLDSNGNVFQETPGQYLDNSNPVLINFTTGWINLAGLQGFQRAYLFYLLGTYLSPHKLQVSIAYDYNSSPSQSSIIIPDNFTNVYGGEPVYGAGTYGGPGNDENWRVFLQQQKCKAFQITVQEIYDPSFGQPAGAGLTLSGIDLCVGIKDGKPRLKASRSVG